MDILGVAGLAIGLFGLALSVIIAVGQNSEARMTSDRIEHYLVDFEAGVSVRLDRIDAAMQNVARRLEPPSV